MRALTCLLLAGFLGSLASCQARDARSLWTARGPHFIDPDLQDDAEVLSPAFLWEFLGDSDLGSWKIRQNGGASRIRDGALMVEPSEGPLMIARQVKLDSSAVGTIVVRLAGGTGRIEVFWAGARVRFATERRMLARMVEGAAGTYAVFDVKSHPLWSGRIARLGFRCTATRGKPMRVASIRCLRYSLAPEDLEAASRKPWKVLLGGWARTSILALPGKRMARQIEPEVNGRFRFFYGIQEGVLGPVRFRVSLKRGSDEPATLFDVELNPRRKGDLDQWHEGDIDLGRYAGERVEIVLETLSPSGAAPPIICGFPVWGLPEVLAPAAGPRPPNVVLVSIDTLRADHLSLFGYPRMTSPRIDSWASERAAAFRSVVAAAPWTLPSHVSLFCGTDALTHGQNLSRKVRSSVTTLAEILRAAGYATMAVTGAGFLSPRYGLIQGFDTYFSWHGDIGSAEEVVQGVDRCLDLLRGTARRPFFLFFHTYEVHSPFHAREPYFSTFYPGKGIGKSRYFDLEQIPASKDRGFQMSAVHVSRGGTDRDDVRPVTEAQLDDLIARYDSGIAYVDHHLGRLLDRLCSPDLESNTIVVVTSDHGESLGEHGRAGHFGLYESELLVPLLISDPAGRFAGRILDAQIRSTDIFPTVLDLAGMPVPPEIDGRSLVPLLEGTDAEANRRAWSYSAETNFGVALREKDLHKFIFNDTVWSPHRGETELYHLRSDPSESRNLAEADAETQAMRARVVERLERDFRGLWIRFSAGQGISIRGKIVGDAPWQDMKSPNAPKGAMQLRRKGEVEFHVRPAQVYRIQLPGARRSPLVIEGSAGLQDGTEVPFHERVSLDADSLPWVIALDGGSWRVLSLAEPKERRPAVEVHWTGYPDDQTMDPAEDDEELMERLRAMGYLK